MSDELRVRVTVLEGQVASIEARLQTAGLVLVHGEVETEPKDELAEAFMRFRARARKEGHA